jgi:hypothetical protein
LDADLPLLEIHVAPLKCHHFSAPQPSLAAQQHDEVTVRVESSCRFHQVFKVIEVVEPC